MSRKVFVSYSWDNRTHEEWVLGLVADLRDAGIEATLDKSITQEGLVNLNKMMVDGFKDSDKVIIVLSENYAERADNIMGGVGFETILSFPILRSNPDKLIIISRHHSELSKSIPFHFQGYYIIDFSQDKDYANKFSELLHRIQDSKQYALPDVGPIKDLPSKMIRGHLEKTMDDLIPNLKQYSESNKEEFLIHELNMIWSTLIDFSRRTKAANPHFEIDIILDNKTEKKILFKVNGVIKAGIHMRLSRILSSQWRIILSYNSNFQTWDTNSFNDMINCSINERNELELSGLEMNIFGSRDTKEASELAKNIWKNHIVPKLKM